MAVIARAQTVSPWRLSIIIEWANTILNGEERAARLVERLGEEWLAICADRYPANLTGDAVELLRRRDPRLELLIVSGVTGVHACADDLRRRVPASVDVAIHVAEGLEYYPLKNFGAGLARGDFLLFIDSDVIPEEGWLAHLLGSFAQAEIGVVCGQTYVAPTHLFARAFALGWTYSLRDESGKLIRPTKFYANNIAFRSDVFRKTGFPPIGRRTRGAASLLLQELDRLNVPMWENRSARVDHPPPSGFRHLAIRGLAHGRDTYMKDSEERNLHGLVRSTVVAAGRLGRAVYRTFRSWRRVGLRPWEVPAAIAICSGYYAFFALGGVLTHLNPAAMGRRFRV